MTVHTRAATDEIYGIFSQPLKSAAERDKYADSTCESDFDDDDYTSAGESTGTGRISGTSEYGDDETGVKAFEDNETEVKSVSEWSDFSASKHVPRLDEDEGGHAQDDYDEGLVVQEDSHDERDVVSKDEELVTPTSPHMEQGRTRTRYIPLPPEDYEAPTRPYRDASQASQNRLPFMTPIVEKTESSLAPSTVYQEKDYFNSKTPSRRHGQDTPIIPELEDETFSPLREVINEAVIGRRKDVHSKADLDGIPGKLQITPRSASTDKGLQPHGPIILDAQCNPVDDSVRNTILDHAQPPLSSYDHFFEHKGTKNGKSAEIRRFAKALAKMNKNSSDKTTTNVSLPPVLRLEGADRTYLIKRELGKGAFAPVYLAEDASTEEPDDDIDVHNSIGRRERLEAIKMEDPPTAWEFYIMRQAALRLGTSRPASSVIRAHELHLFADECFLVEDYRDQGTLLDLVNLAKTEPTSTSSSSSGGVMDECLAMFFAIELFRTVEALHAHGILHGDLKADNCLVRFDTVASPSPPSTSSSSFSSSSTNSISTSIPSTDVDTTWSARYQPDGSHGWSSKGLGLIDFGRGIDLHAFRPDATFIADWKTGPADCAEMRDMRPWTYQVDYFGLAGVLHCLLFGKYIDTVVVDTPPAPLAVAAGVESADGDDEDNDERGLDLGLGLGLGLGVTLGHPAARKRYKLREPLKRYWATEIWGRVFELLLNPTLASAAGVQGEGSGGKLPVLKAMRVVREGMEEWLVGNAERRGLKGLIRRLEARGGRRV